MSDTQAKATPRPWKVWEQSPTFIELEDGTPIASMTLGMNYQPHEFADKQREMVSNARLIVRAVNNHDKLLEALKACLNMVSGDGRPPDWDLVRAAIQSAEEEEEPNDRNQSK